MIVFNDELIKGIHTFDGSTLKVSSIFTINMNTLEITMESQDYNKIYMSGRISISKGQCKKIK